MGLPTRFGKTRLYEWVPLVPKRTLTLNRSAGTLSVSLEGRLWSHGFGSPLANRVDVILEYCQLPPGMSPRAVDLTAFEPPTDGTPAWIPVLGQTHTPTRANNEHPGIKPETWSAQLQLPVGLRPLRVRVREVELIGSFNNLGGFPVSHAGTSEELTERTVFADTVQLVGPSSFQREG
jgi:hypothetical protein